MFPTVGGETANNTGNEEMAYESLMVFAGNASVGLAENVVKHLGISLGRASVGKFSDGEINEYTSEFHGYLEEKKREAHQKMNRLLGDGGIIDKDMLKDRVVILASDGFGDDLSVLDVALSFLKSVRIEKLVIAVPFCGVAAVDKLHMTVDEMHILDVKENFMGLNHYYEDNTLPSKEETIAKINQVILNWK